MNILSVLSWVATEGTGSYAVAKAAEWNMTNGVRLKLSGQRALGHRRTDLVRQSSR
ncbi:hypothetical protein ABT030_50320 [Streptomyces mirabilis]|uniref:hypothetical protein n=1 Tax=Streptomyces mirabilis TaxID=68239 RepID=UPI003330E341